MYCERREERVGNTEIGAKNIVKIVVGVLANVLVIVSYFCDFFKYKGALVQGEAEVLKEFLKIKHFSLWLYAELSSQNIWIFVLLSVLAIVFAWLRKSAVSMICTVVSLLPGLFMAMVYAFDGRQLSTTIPWAMNLYTSEGFLSAFYSFSIGPALEVLAFIMAVVAAVMPKEIRR